MIDHTCDIAEIAALAETIVELDRNNVELHNRAAPFLIRILADKANALVICHDEALEQARAEGRKQ